MEVNSRYPQTGRQLPQVFSRNFIIDSTIKQEMPPPPPGPGSRESLSYSLLLFVCLSGLSAQQPEQRFRGLGQLLALYLSPFRSKGAPEFP